MLPGNVGEARNWVKSDKAKVKSKSKLDKSKLNRSCWEGDLGKVFRGLSKGMEPVTDSSIGKAMPLRSVSRICKYYKYL